MPATTDLGRKMELLVVQHPERAEEIQKAINDFEEHAGGPDAKKWLGKWVRARRLYCELTGEPMV